MDKIQQARTLLLNYIREQCDQKGITQADLAEKTGFKQSNISRMLAGKYTPSLDNFIKLAEAANCYLFIIEKNENDELTALMKKRWSRKADKN